ncbi:MAG: tetratricopeptide repeat protein [Flavobacteriaceae bacterium]|nr:tetratricopeptide repeat protein [Flavobacteriaceae bacterium]
MKKFLKTVKVIFTVLFLAYTIVILYFLFFSPKEERFIIAENKQGVYLSQSMFNILTFQHPDFSDTYFEQSVSFNKRGDFSKGFQLLNKAVEIDPKLHLGYRGWIRLRKMRDFDKALIDFNRLDSLTTNFVDAPWGEDIDFLRGECYFGNNDYQKAIDFFNRSVNNQKEDWADIQTFVYLGICEYELGNYEKAVSEFKRALNQSENTCEAHFGLAKTYQEMGNLEKAKEHILKAEENIGYKRNDIYNEFLNEIYLSEILEFKQQLNK